MSLKPKTQNIIDFSYIGDVGYTTQALRIRDELFKKYSLVMNKIMLEHRPEFIDQLKGGVESEMPGDFEKFLQSKKIKPTQEGSEAQMFFANAHSKKDCYLPVFELKEKYKSFVEYSKDADGLAHAVVHIIKKQVGRDKNKTKILKPKVYMNTAGGPVVVDIDSVIKAKAGHDSRPLIKKALKHMADKSEATGVATISGSRAAGYTVFSEFEDGSRHLVTFDVTLDDEGFINGIKNEEEHSNLFGDINGKFFGILSPKQY